MKKLIFLIILFSCLGMFAEVMVMGNVPKPLNYKLSGNLAEYLNQNEIFADAAMLCGDNGTSAYIEYPAFELIKIDSTSSGWNVIAPLLPAVCQIRNLQEIWIFEGFWKTTLTISINQNNVRYNPFTWNLQKYSNVAESEKNGYRALKYLPAEYSFPLEIGTRALITYNDGEEEAIDFVIEQFNFDGCEFYYNQKPVRMLKMEN